MHATLRYAATALTLTAALAAIPFEARADYVLDLDPEQGCLFPLRIKSVGEQNRVHREVLDSNGNIVRILSAGRGAHLTFTNLATGSEIDMGTGGSVSKIAFRPDGTATATFTGYNVVVLFPTDNPAGPSTKLYIGRLVFEVDANSVWTQKSAAGTTRTDICAELSS